MALQMHVPLAKPGPIRDGGNASVLTYLGRNQNKGWGQSFNSSQKRGGGENM